MRQGSPQPLWLNNSRSKVASPPTDTPQHPTPLAAIAINPQRTEINRSEKTKTQKMKEDKNMRTSPQHPTSLAVIAINPQKNRNESIRKDKNTKKKKDIKTLRYTSHILQPQS